MSYINHPLKESDPTLFALGEEELARVRNTIQLIPSENFTSRGVMEMTGSIFTNKYAEGYPGKRYYEGNEVVDKVENLAIERAKALFGAEHANVQPLSGGPANMSVYAALLEEGDKVLSMDLAQGGHLTHGAPVNFSGKQYHFVHYPVDQETHEIDMKVVEELALKEKPKMIVAGASAYPRTIDFATFRAIADKVGALLMADISHIAGLVATGAHPDAVKYADVVTTTTHKTLRGPRGALIMCKQEYAKAIDKAVFPKIQAGPHMNTIAAKAVAFHEASTPLFKEYIDEVVMGAKMLATTLQERGWKLTTGGTDNHLMVIDLRDTELTGADAASKLARCGIVTNKNMVPYDHRSPFVTSGVRIGTPAMTSRGFTEEDWRWTGYFIDKALRALPEEEKNISMEISTYLSDFPLYEFLNT